MAAGGRAARMDLDARRTGVVVAAVGVLLLLTLRVWASPVALAITGREHASTLTFLAMPVGLLVVGLGIAIAVWGEEYGLG